MKRVHYTLLSILLLLFVLLLFVAKNAALLFPASSVLQLTSCTSVPLEIPERKLFMNWCIQMSYDLPADPAKIYNSPIWPDVFNDNSRSTRDLSINYVNNEKSNTTKWRKLAKYQHINANGSMELHPSDFTAAELYENLENSLVSYGFHESCLLRSVCELARHPFAQNQQNMLTDILTFILTPSLHESFAKHEHIYRDVYEEAETMGFLGFECANLYDDCKQDFLSAITKII